MPLRWYLDNDYAALVDDVISSGHHRKGRNGGFCSLFGTTLMVDLRGGFPLISTRKIFWRGVAAELAAFLEGSTSLARFQELGCNYWNANAIEWPQFDGDNLGPIYGAQWRNFNGVDQLANLISSLQLNPTSRRHLMTTWNPRQLHEMCLPPCHVLTQFHVVGVTLHQTVTMRSVDLCLGLPSDLVLYGLLQHLVAKEVDLEVGELHFMLGDAHVYDNHRKDWLIQRDRHGGDIGPALELSSNTSLFTFHPDNATIHNYTPREAIRYAFN